MARKREIHYRAKRAAHVTPKRKGWRLFVSKGNRFHKAALLQTFRSKGGTFAIFRIEG